jgi:diguanylate cyclase (GGDEF)-like protein/PAS domain S-box-containing protein
LIVNKLLEYQLAQVGYDGSLDERQMLSLLQSISQAYDKSDRIRAYQRNMLNVAKEKIQKLDEILKDKNSSILMHANQKYEMLLSNLKPYYFFYTRSSKGELISISDSVTAMLGFTPDEFIKVYNQEFSYGLRSDLETKMLVSEYGYNIPYEINLKAKDGRLFYLEITEYPVFDEENQIESIEGIVHDITEYVTTKNRVSNMLYTDTLTGISNRLHLEVLMERLILDRRTHDNHFAMLFIDLDHFKHINDTLGHDIGDLLLQNVAESIRDNIRDNDIFARIGGDEFVIIFKNLEPDDLLSAINKLMRLMQQEWKINQYRLNVSASIGVVRYPEDGKSTVELMKSADIAMYQSKKEGRNQYTFYNQSYRNNIHNEAELIQDMIPALENNEFVLLFQPKVTVSTNRVISAEALMRWYHPQKGHIGPGVFIPLAESSGFIIQLGKWLVEEACKSIAWFNECNADKKLNLSINISIRQFEHESIYDILKENIEKYNICASQIAIEITESIMMKNPDEMAEKLNKIKTLGVTISLDDFGTGYSTLSYLHKLSIDELKIDKAFVDDIVTDGDKSIVLDTIIAMGKTLNMSVVAEGVEHEYQRKYLEDKGCDIYQGYLFSKPLMREEYVAAYILE